MAEKLQTRMMMSNKPILEIEHGLITDDSEPSRWIFLGYPLKSIDMYLSLVPLFIAIPLGRMGLWSAGQTRGEK